LEGLPLPSRHPCDDLQQALNLVLQFPHMYSQPDNCLLVVFQDLTQALLFGTLEPEFNQLSAVQA